MKPCFKICHFITESCKWWITQHQWKSQTCCGFSSSLLSPTLLLFIPPDSESVATVSFFTRYRMPGVSGREAINCSSRGRSFCRISVVSGAAELLQLNDCNVFSWLSDANESSGLSSACTLVCINLQSLLYPTINSITSERIYHLQYVLSSSRNRMSVYLKIATEYNSQLYSCNKWIWQWMVMQWVSEWVSRV